MFEPDATRAELRRQYELAVDEYRFQVGLNWRRSEYFFVLNLGMLIAGTTLLGSGKVPDVLVACVFGAGALLAVVSIFANETQHGYYRSARQLKGDLEGKLRIERVAIATTPGMGSAIARVVSVRRFLAAMLIAIAAVDLTGIAIILEEDLVDANPSKVALLIRAPFERPVAPLVVSDSGGVVMTRSIEATGQTLVRLEPGTYRMWHAAGLRCNQSITVSSAPVQAAYLEC